MLAITMSTERVFGGVALLHSIGISGHIGVAILARRTTSEFSGVTKVIFNALYIGSLAL